MGERIKMDKLVNYLLAEIGVVGGTIVLILGVEGACRIKECDLNENRTSQLVQKVQAESPLVRPTPAVFDNADGTTRTLYAREQSNGAYHFSFDPTTGTLQAEDYNSGGKN